MSLNYWYAAPETGMIWSARDKMSHSGSGASFTSYTVHGLCERTTYNVNFHILSLILLCRFVTHTITRYVAAGRTFSWTNKQTWRRENLTQRGNSEQEEEKTGCVCRMDVVWVWHGPESFHITLLTPDTTDLFYHQGKNHVKLHRESIRILVQCE